MHRHDWRELPASVRAAVREHCGDVVDTRTPDAGRNSHFAATLHLATGGTVFCKGVRVDSNAARTHRREAHVNRAIHTAFAPRLLWRIETDGWLMLGFEHVTGRHPSLTPGSADLPVIAETLSSLARDLTPNPVDDIPSLSHKWARAKPWHRLRDDPAPGLDEWTRARLNRFAALEPVAAELVTGHTLTHTDVHELNLLVDDRSAHLVDWAWAHHAAAWVDTAFLLIRLIQHGHTPAEAESWATTVDSWRAAPSAVDAFAIQIYGMWEHLRHTDPRPIREAPTRAARRWAMHRSGE
ncbi:hypothetical protein [Actinophytocola gossypii]|uniref:Aminoglycoside phosphotransferase domain-containing protein n=1 Tax=Actinophytocola gossypii TaxID=2812003 RepID=A0ABT2JIH7_9PSEU|nr:hypothetical protein [Actinophytocola gossypii]MCT2587682.1 hypothetical protein [Actinophytocola gossypii]